ncbi:farnesyl-diphosphate synthase [Boletus coccyginus]|nr:farnesyl-diphosphate synthase [Boletus coccyginus]
MTTDLKAQQRRKFLGVFEELRDELVDHLKWENMPTEAVEWYRRSLDFNVPGGKLTRGLGVVESAKILKGRELTDDEYFKAAVLGWCVELFLAFLLVADDMMDHSITRRGRPCWYRVQGVGNIAINDAIMLEGSVYHLLKKHFREESYYVDLLEVFHDSTFPTEMGELVDLITAPEDDVDLSKFSFEKYTFIARYKTGHACFYLSVAVAMRVCGVPESYVVDGQTVRPYELALSILLPLGEYFQIQDDFLDYVGTPEQIGKIGTDIVDNKCSWCINVALAVATPEQRAVLDANYGRKDVEREARVKEVFDAVGLRERYRTYEEGVKEKLDALIAGVPESEEGVGGVLRRELFIAFLNKIYKRTK